MSDFTSGFWSIYIVGITFVATLDAAVTQADAVGAAQLRVGAGVRDEFEQFDGRLRAGVAHGHETPVSSGNAGQARVEALVLHREPLVIDAEQIEHRGVEIVDVHFVVHRVPAEFVRRAVDMPATRAATRHPHRETTWVMVTTIGFFS